MWCLVALRPHLRRDEENSCRATTPPRRTPLLARAAALLLPETFARDLRKRPRKEKHAADAEDLIGRRDDQQSPCPPLPAICGAQQLPRRAPLADRSWRGEGSAPSPSTRTSLKRRMPPARRRRLPSTPTQRSSVRASRVRRAPSTSRGGSTTAPIMCDASREARATPNFSPPTHALFRIANPT